LEKEARIGSPLLAAGWFIWIILVVEGTSAVQNPFFKKQMEQLYVVVESAEK
jgi:hypothetical protein